MKGKPYGRGSGKHRSSGKPFRMCVGGVVFPDSGSNVAQKGQSAGHFHTACKQNPFLYRESHSVLAVFKRLSSHYSRYFTILCSFLNLDFKIKKKILFIFSAWSESFASPCCSSV